MSFENIVNGIFSYIDGVAGLPDIYYPNSKNPSRSQPPDDSYLMVDILSADTDTFTINDSSEYPGILQVIICTRADTGVITAYGIADDILTAFKDCEIVEGTSKIRFDQVGTVAPPLPGGDGWYRLPVNLQYRLFE